jgi:hypothetical protein
MKASGFSFDVLNGRKRALLFVTAFSTYDLVRKEVQWASFKDQKVCRRTLRYEMCGESERWLLDSIPRSKYLRDVPHFLYKGFPWRAPTSRTRYSELPSRQSCLGTKGSKAYVPVMKASVFDVFLLQKQAPHKMCTRDRFCRSSSILLYFIGMQSIQHFSIRPPRLGPPRQLDPPSRLSRSYYHA